MPCAKALAAWPLGLLIMSPWRVASVPSLLFYSFQGIAFIFSFFSSSIFIPPSPPYPLFSLPGEGAELRPRSLRR